MAKSSKAKGIAGKPSDESGKDIAKKAIPKSKLKAEENGDDEDFDLDSEDLKPVKKAGKAVSSKKEDDDDDAEDVVDDWDKVEEEEEWDPDFEEFDLPKSKVKKTTGGKKAADDDDDLKLDDEFKDLFNEKDSFDDDEEEDY